jgi:hypothetical protein
MPQPTYRPTRVGPSSAVRQASLSARLAAATAIGLTRSSPTCWSNVNHARASNSTVAAAAGFGSSGKMRCTAGSPRMSAPNIACATSPCRLTAPMPVKPAVAPHAITLSAARRPARP